MALPTTQVTLTAEQVADLSKRLSELRHDINNKLALIAAAAELIKVNPDSAQRMLSTLMEQPAKIREQIQQFSVVFDEFLGIGRP